MPVSPCPRVLSATRLPIKIPRETTRLVQAMAQRNVRQGYYSLEVPEVRPETPRGFGKRNPKSGRVQYAAYWLAIAVCVSTWFVAIRAPLWLDETISFFLIKGGFAGIMSRQVWPDAPAYSCLLWLWTRAIGTAEITLRISSILPMAGAVYLLYCSARRLFERDLALIATIIFCLHPIVVFASIDVRPYAFAALAVNSSLFVLVCLRDNDSTWLAALFGLTAAFIVQFHLLFAVILPALLLCFFALKNRKGKSFWRQLGVALVIFALALLPAIRRLLMLRRTGSTHVFSTAPRLTQLGSTLAVRGSAVVLIIGVIFALGTRRLSFKSLPNRWTILLCLSLALVPALTLFSLSTATPIHVFIPRYELVAVPGIALSWALVASLMDSRPLRLWCALAMVAVMASISFTSASARSHGQSWKAALAFVDKNASGDNAPVLICSGISESDYMVMPTGAAIENSGVLVQLSYYKLGDPVVPLPHSLNEQAMRLGSRFVEQEAYRHERFLAMAFAQSSRTLDWLARDAMGTDYVHELGVFDGIRVLEFVPRDARYEANANLSQRAPASPDEARVRSSLHP